MSQIPEPNENTGSEWGIYHGKMNWNQAMQESAKLGMRLPSRKELLAAYQDGLLKPWLENGYLFWTSDEFSDSYAYALYVSSGHNYYYRKSDEWHARFIK